MRNQELRGGGVRAIVQGDVMGIPVVREYLKHNDAERNVELEDVVWDS